MPNSSSHSSSLMDSHIEGHEDASSAIRAQGEAPQPPNEVEQSANLNVKPLKINPGKVLTALRHLRIDRSRIKPLDTGSSSNDARAGRYGVVIPAVLDSDTSNHDTPTLEDSNFVAVKKLHYGEDADVDRVLSGFALEIKLLSDLHHKNVVDLVGFVEEAEKGIAWMVFRWEKKGNLREFVRSEKWELPERVSLINDVAEGLAYLHERQPPICHGDLKSLNILVNDGNRAMITDFGSARTIDRQTEEPTISPVRVVGEASEHLQAQQRSLERLTAEFLQSGNSLTMTGPAWTIRWAAPELLLLEGALPTLASDIWALGWIFWEGITGNFPFEDENKDVAVVLRITSGELPALDTDAQLIQIKALCSLMADCWSLRPNERPSAGACQQRLNFMSQSVPSKDPGSRSCELLWALGYIQAFNANYDAAAKYWREAKNVAEAAENWHGFAQCIQALGDAYLRRSEYSEAEEAFIKARDVFSQIGNRQGVAQCLRRLGHVYRMRNEYSEAEEAYIKARDVSSQIGHRRDVAQCLQGLGDVYQIRSEYSEAEEAFIKAHDVLSQIGDRMGVAQCLQRLGHVYCMRNEYSEAEEAFIKAHDVFSQIGNRLGVAECLRGLGDVYRMRNEHSEAEEAFIKARDVFSQIGNRQDVAQCLRGLGDVYRIRSEHSAAEEAYIKAHDVFSQIGEAMSVAQCLHGLGDVYRMRNEHSAAEEALIKARDIFSQIGDRLGVAECLRSLGDVYRRWSEHSAAEEAYIKAHDVFSQIGDRLGVALCLQGLGDVYRMRNKYSEAEQAYSDSR